ASPGRITGLGVLGIGAQPVPGGIRMWGTPSVAVASVPALVAGMQLINTGPVTGAPVTLAIAAPSARPTASPAGSKTIPTKGLGNGVGIGPPGVGMNSQWMSTPRQRSNHVLASIGSGLGLAGPERGADRGPGGVQGHSGEGIG